MIIYFIYFYIFLIFLIIIIIIFPSNLFKFHPLTLNLLLIFYIIIICLKINFLKNIYWYSYVLFLVIIGGLIILFLYFTSLASNQLFYLKFNFRIYLFLKLFYLFLIFIYLYFRVENWILNNFIIVNNLEIFSLEILNIDYEQYLYIDLIKDFCLSINLYLVRYLFIIIVCLVLICLKVNIPIRQLIKFYEKII